MKNNSLKRACRQLFFWSTYLGTGICASFTRAVVFFAFTAIAEILERDKFKVTLKRVLVFIILAHIVFLLVIWNHIGFFLDEIFFPEWKNQDIKSPLFIIGNARSGTTWVHRLLLLNEVDFISMKSWEIFCAASVTWRWLFHKLHQIDKMYCNGRFLNSWMILESYFLSKSKLHPIGLFEYEEDEWITIHIFFSQLILLMFPSGGFLLYPLVKFDEFSDDLVPLATRKLVMTYYRDCVKRHLYFYKRTSIFVCKNPPFTMRLDTISQLFHDARILCMIRNPRCSVPSMVSYISHAWHFFASPRVKFPDLEELKSFCLSHYSFPLEFMPKEQQSITFVSYERLRKNLKGELLKALIVLKYFSEVPERYLKFEGMLARQQRLTDSYASCHIYDLEKCCGVTQQEFNELFKSVYERHSEILTA